MVGLVCVADSLPNELARLDRVQRAREHAVELGFVHFVARKEAARWVRAMRKMRANVRHSARLVVQQKRKERMADISVAQTNNEQTDTESDLRYPTPNATGRTSAVGRVSCIWIGRPSFRRG